MKRWCSIVEDWKFMGGNAAMGVLELKESLVAEENEDRNFIQKNERSLKEVLKEVLIAKDYEKMFPIIEYLEGNLVISTQIAEQLTGRSSATAWRYLKKLVEAGVIEPDGNTNNAGYRKIVK